MKNTAILVLFLTGCFFLTPPVLAEDPTDFVDPFIGTGGHGHTYPGATVLFGAVQLSPDTRLKGWDGCSGYHYSDSVVFGFSHTHLSGTGVPDYCDILFTPITGTVNFFRGSPENPSSGYCSRFSHENEKASPGYYEVLLDDYNIKVELTATERCGFHRYAFPPDSSAVVIVDLSHRDRVLDSWMEVISDREIRGYRRSSSWAKDQRVYFTAIFSEPFKSYLFARNDSILHGERRISGTNVKIALTFEKLKKGKLLVKVGLSAVDTDGAERNLKVEIPGWDFDGTVREAAEKWKKALGKIKVYGGTKKQKRIFYTALYHSLLCPNIFMDVDGRFRGADKKVHKAENFTNYTVFSLWDTYRAEHPLLTIIEPEKTLDFIKTMLKFYKLGGSLPVWELAGNETWCMIGYHSVSVIADACAKGIRSFDTEKALKAMLESAGSNRFSIDHYRKYGYIPGELGSESVSRTLEYAYDDWCIARFALLTGHKDIYREFIARAQYYKNILDPATGFMRAKVNSAWVEPFDPREVNFHYTEANSWQYSFYVPQDITTLINLLGGNEAFCQRLDSLFNAPAEITGRNQPDISGMIGQYAHGNEPSHHIAYLYSYAGNPWKTQKLVKQIINTLYNDTPDGLCGNEDCGQMSAWFVMSALGFYPVTPGSNIYIIGSPLFKKAVIDVGGGKKFTIEARGLTDKNIYIKRAWLNGAPYNKCYITHKDIISGGKLTFEMSSLPNKKWGTDKGNFPTSIIKDELITPVPYVLKGERVFRDSTILELSCFIEVDIFYKATPLTEDTMAKSAVKHSCKENFAHGKRGQNNFLQYKHPIKISKNTLIKAFAVSKKTRRKSKMIQARFYLIPNNWKIRIKYPYSQMYSGGGDLALIDGIRGSTDFRTGAWQGFQGVDLDVTIDLGEKRSIEEISIGFLQDQRSWIFMPEEVIYFISEDGELFEKMTTIKNDVPQTVEDVVIKDFKASNLHTKGRYVRIVAKNINTCPPWHRGAGGKAWIFADEISIR